MRLAVGARLGPYEILAPLGAGGMGEVYRARDTRLDRSVAIKVLTSSAVDRLVRRERFEREARIISQLTHPHICTLYDVGRHDHTDFLVMEYLEGETLESRLKRGPLPVMDVLEIAIEIADAMDKAHRDGIVHRDLKPANVMLTESGVKLLDFGVATIAQPPDEAATPDGDVTSDSRFITKPGEVVGTMDYMSPEQLRAQPLDQRTDIWSLGVVLYQMVWGCLPFDGPTRSDVISAILLQEPRPQPPDALRAPDWLREIIANALQKDSERRFQAAREILTQLKRQKRRLEIEAEIEHMGPVTAIPPNSPVGARDAASGPLATLGSARTLWTDWRRDKLQRHKLALMVGGTLVVAAALASVSIFYSVAILATAGCAIASFIYFSETDSVAVMPFEWVGQSTEGPADPEREYLADGITESIINALSQLDKLKVIARTSVFRYKGRTTEAHQIRRELDVRKILTGRIIQRASSLTVRVELVDVVDNKHVWGEQYDRPHSSLANLPRDIASEISRSLRGRWARRTAVRDRRYRVSATHSPSADAYEAYLKGKFSWNKRTEPEIRKAIELFRQAASQDPAYALAYVGQAECYLGLGVYSSIPLRDAYAQAKLLAMKAIELDDSLGEAHAVLAVVKAGEDWDIQGALHEFSRAIQLNPSHATAHQWYAEHLVCVGRVAEAIAESLRARELDPASWIVSASAGTVLLLAREYDRAIDQLRLAIAMNHAHFYSHIALRDAFLAKDMFEAAIAEEQEARKLAGDDEESAERLGRSLRETYFGAGPLGYWQKRLEMAAEDLGRPSHLPYDVADSSPYHVAVICARLGQREVAIRWIEKAYEERDYYIYCLRTNPAFDNIQADLRVAAVLRRIGLAS